MACCVHPNRDHPSQKQCYLLLPERKKEKVIKIMHEYNPWSIPLKIDKRQYKLFPLGNKDCK
jgi:hypothetical protein